LRIARNLRRRIPSGMTTVLVIPEGAREIIREAWELEGRDADHVDYVTDDLVCFLANPIAALSSASLCVQDRRRTKLYRGDDS